MADLRTRPSRPSQARRCLGEHLPGTKDDCCFTQGLGGYAAAPSHPARKAGGVSGSLFLPSQNSWLPGVVAAAAARTLGLHTLSPHTMPGAGRRAAKRAARARESAGRLRARILHIRAGFESPRPPDGPPAPALGQGAAEARRLQVTGPSRPVTLRMRGPSSPPLGFSEEFLRKFLQRLQNHICQQKISSFLKLESQLKVKLS